MEDNMCKTQLAIYNRQFDFICAQGQEKRLHKIANMLNEHIHKVSQGMQVFSELHLFAMAAILLQDELQTLKENSENYDHIQKIQQYNHDAHLNQILFENLEPIVIYIEKLVESLESIIDEEE